MTTRLNAFALLAASLLYVPSVVFAQAPASPTTPASVPLPQAQASPAINLNGAGISEDQIRGQLTNKLLFLRGFYLDDNLKFNEHGSIIGSSPKGSFTLCAVEVKKVHLTKHALELEGDRYGLHFFGALPYEDDSKPFDRVRLTTKKSVKITIDRELVVIPKVKKPKKGEKDKTPVVAKKDAPGTAAKPDQDDTNDSATATVAEAAPASGTAVAPSAAAAASAAAVGAPADPNARTSTSSPAHSAQVMKDALANIFADRIDEKMMASLPDYWQHYYQEKVNRKEFTPADPAVLRVGGDVSAPRLLNGLEPGSNDFAQKNGIAGLTVFRTVVDAQGKPAEIAIARPIGFGLDEKAIDAIRNSHFKPATKDGQPVPVVVDLVVTFRIYSNRTRGGQVGTPGVKPAAVESAALPQAGATPGNGR
jgi:TonB family protein